MADEEQVANACLAERERETRHYLELTLLGPAHEQHARPTIDVLPRRARDEYETSLDECERSLESQLMIGIGAT